MTAEATLLELAAFRNAAVSHNVPDEWWGMDLEALRAKLLGDELDPSPDAEAYRWFNITRSIQLVATSIQLVQLGASTRQPGFAAYLGAWTRCREFSSPGARKLITERAVPLVTGGVVVSEFDEPTAWLEPLLEAWAIVVQVGHAMHLVSANVAERVPRIVSEWTRRSRTSRIAGPHNGLLEWLLKALVLDEDIARVTSIRFLDRVAGIAYGPNALGCPDLDALFTLIRPKAQHRTGSAIHGERRSRELNARRSIWDRLESVRAPALTADTQGAQPRYNGPKRASLKLSVTVRAFDDFAPSAPHDHEAATVIQQSVAFDAPFIFNGQLAAFVVEQESLQLRRLPFLGYRVGIEPPWFTMGASCVFRTTDGYAIALERSQRVAIDSSSSENRRLGGFGGVVSYRLASEVVTPSGLLAEIAVAGLHHELEREARWLPRDDIQVGPTHLVWSLKANHLEAVHVVDVPGSMEDQRTLWSKWRQERREGRPGPDETFEGNEPCAFLWDSWKDIDEERRVDTHEFGSRRVYGRGERGIRRFNLFSDMMLCAALVLRRS